MSSRHRLQVWKDYYRLLYLLLQ
jgi:hypothetical protein